MSEEIVYLPGYSATEELPDSSGYAERDEVTTSEQPVLVPILASDQLRETMAPTSEQELQHLLGKMHEVSSSLIKHSNPANFNDWPSLVNGWPARLTKEAYQYQPNGPGGSTVYARLALFAPARYYEGTEEPCIIISLDNTTKDIKSCGESRRGTIIRFYQANDQILLLSGADYLPYASNSPEDIAFARTVIENIRGQMLKRLRAQALSSAQTTLNQHKEKLARAAGLSPEEVLLVPENIVQLTCTEDEDEPRELGSVHDGHYYDADGREITLNEFITQPYVSQVFELIFKSVVRRQS